MSYQVLARKWRPRSFAEVIGQGHVLKALTNALDSDRLHHAYLFTGTRGVGKTTLARVFAKALNCDRGVSSSPCGECSACTEIDQGRFVDLIEVDAASRTKVDETRELLDNVQYAPTRARYKVYLIDEVHMFSNHSFNALLKTLEEPPPHVKFLLATTDPKKLPITILSRCLQFNLTRLGVSVIAEHLAKVLDAEGITHEAPALAAVAQAADGSVRDALSLLDQAIAHGDGSVRADEVAHMLGTVDQGRVASLLTALAAGDAKALVATARDLADYAPDYAQVLADVLSTLRRIAVVHALGADSDDIEPEPRISELAALIAPDECQLYYQIALNGRRDLDISPDPESGFEMVLLRMLAFRPERAPADTTGGAVSTSGGRSKAAAPAPAAGADAAPAAAANSAPPGAASSAPAPSAREAAAASRAPAPGIASAPDTPAVVSVSSGGPPLSAEMDWNQLIEEIGLVGLPRELARNSALAAFDGRSVSLILSPQFEKLAQRRHVEALGAALSVRHGSDVSVDISIRDDESVMTPSAQREAEAAARQREAEQAIEADPNVQALRDRFGATIEDVSAR